MLLFDLSEAVLYLIPRFLSLILFACIFNETFHFTFICMYVFKTEVFTCIIFSFGSILRIFLWQKMRNVSDLFLKMSSVVNLCKHFGLRSGPTKPQVWSGSKLFDTLMASLKFSGIFSKYEFEKSQQATKKNTWKITQHVKLSFVFVNLFMKSFTVKILSRLLLWCISWIFSTGYIVCVGLVLICFSFIHIYPSLVLVKPRKNRPA